MGKWDKFRRKLLSRESDNNIEFDTLVAYLKRLGFEERIHGSHHIYSREDVVEIIDLQPLSDGKAKPYQVKQVREIIEQYGL